MNSHLSSVKIAHSLAERGKRFNAGIVKRFKDYFPEKELAINAKSHIFEKEHMRLIECAAQTLSWLQPRIDDDRTEAIKLVKFYRKSIIEARYNTDPNECTSIINKKREKIINEKITNLPTRLPSSKESDTPLKPSKTLGIIAGLQTWSKFEFRQPNKNVNVSLRILQKDVLSVNNNRVNWTAIAPIKLYALDRPNLGYSWPEGPDPDTNKDCYLPIGRRVSASIKVLFGIDIGESEREHKTAQQLQVRLKELANYENGNFSLLDINSGLQTFKSIDELMEKE